MITAPKRNRLATKLQLRCHTCKASCLPKEGDWHDGEENQIFLCQSCSKVARYSKPKTLLGTVGSLAIAKTAKPITITHR